MPKTDPATDVRPPPPERMLKPRLRSDELFRGRQEVEIDHQGEVYRLRVTRAGKLILTK